MTKDERFLIELYRETQSQPEDVEVIIHSAAIAKRLGYKEQLTKEILKGLGQANFIKIIDPGEIVLTERGRQVAHSLVNAS